MESHPKMVGRILEFSSPWQFNCNANKDEILLVKYLPRPERLPWPVKLLYTGTGAAFVVLYEECLWWNEIPSTLHPMCSDLEKFSSALKLMESQSRPKVTSFYNCCPLKTQILKLWRITGGNLPWRPSTLRKPKTFDQNSLFFAGHQYFPTVQWSPLTWHVVTLRHDCHVTLVTNHLSSWHQVQGRLVTQARDATLLWENSRDEWRIL